MILLQCVHLQRAPILYLQMVWDIHKHNHVFEIFYLRNIHHNYMFHHRTMLISYDSNNVIHNYMIYLYAQFLLIHHFLAGKSMAPFHHSLEFYASYQDKCFSLSAWNISSFHANYWDALDYFSTCQWSKLCKQAIKDCVYGTQYE